MRPVIQLDAVAVTELGGRRAEILRGRCGRRTGRAWSSGAERARDDLRQVAVADHLLPIRVGDDGAIHLIEIPTLERVADLLAPALHRVTARVLAENERRLRHAYFFGSHDLVGAAVLEEVVLGDDPLA